MGLTMDDADMAADRADRLEPYLVAASLKAVGPKATGYCLYCDTPLLSKVYRWCDADCRDNHQCLQNRKLNKK